MTADDHELQDLAADLHDHGYSWEHIARELAIPVATAQLAAGQARQRAADRAARDQITLF
ncbi:hypothetical protein [Gordonia rhizosphera]|uniref:Uncharacterized protein n=1 Tax=Gordonia rhizosphera NBRC 16068 TaxID=1108045 RepID=K6UZV7_9ACTN|nr:hypothetical protein [Gordonia rhizosphera]GAB89083.1 hypothetical protein GORHZ_049_00160 [Gordonia rhizosphera NBRC 16068]